MGLALKLDPGASSPLGVLDAKFGREKKIQVAPGGREKKILGFLRFFPPTKSKILKKEFHLQDFDESKEKSTSMKSTCKSAKNS